MFITIYLKWRSLVVDNSNKKQIEKQQNGVLTKQ